VKSQQRFKFPRQPKREKTISKQRDGFEAANLRNARQFLAAPETYPGFPQIWARLVLNRLAPVKSPEKSGQLAA
jgi:hypothetical protein